MKFNFLLLSFILIFVSINASAQPVDKLLLNDTDIRYELNSQPMASNFRQSQRYWLYIPIRNTTDKAEWVLHVSDFSIDPIAWLLSANLDADAILTNQINEFTPTEDNKADYINALGRAFRLHLEENKNYVLAVELSADGVLPAPHISLMSEPYYKTWSFYLDYQYKVAIGIILGLIFIALMFGVVLRDVMFFWFSVSSALLLLFFLSRGQIGFDVLESTDLSPQWFWVLAALCQTSVLLLARYFLFGNSKADSLLPLFKLAILSSAIAGALGFFLPSTLNVVLFSALGIGAVGVTMYAAWTKSNVSAPYYWVFMLAWVPTVFSLVELVSIFIFTPETSALSTKIIRDPYLHIVHMVILFVALLMRVLELKKQKYKADIRNESKSRFLATVSQDLRHPLQLMGVHLTHLKDHVDSEPANELYQSVFRLYSAMNDSFGTLMHLSQLNPSEVLVNRKNISLDTLFEKIRLEYETTALSKGIYLRVRRTKKIVKSDPVLLERIFRNLISNAIKYTDKGGVLFACRVRHNHVLVQVWDTGCGISTADQSVIFDLYKRSNDVTNHQQGMGIGLAIVKHLADALAHPVQVTSIEHRGSMFEIQLPLVDVNHIEHSISQLKKSPK